MAKIDWKKVWNKSIKNSELFPAKMLNDKTLSVSCPTRFSGIGQFAIDVTPKFNDDSISFDFLIFNDNVDLDGLEIDKKKKKGEDFNSFANELVEYELSNRIMDHFDIQSDGFKDNTEAENTLVDYINNKATESGRMFDDKLDELNDSIKGIKSDNTESNESYTNTLKTIKDKRAFILRKVESILNNKYKWHAMKNEDFSDSSIPLRDANGNLAAVVSLSDNFLIIDLSKDITAKISMLQSDEEIEDEIANDIAAAQEVLSDREIEQLKNVIAVTPDPIELTNVAEDYDYYQMLEDRVSKLESLYIKRHIRNMK